MAKGRPRKITGARDQRLEIRLTSEEKIALFNAAAAAGVTVTSFLLGHALGERFGDAVLKESSTTFSEKMKF